MSEQPTEVIPQPWTPSIVPGMTAVPAASVLDPSPPESGRAAFDVVLRGYERHQVDRLLADLADRAERLQADLEVAQGRELSALQEASRARAELDRGRPSFDALGERVAQLLGLAEAEADAMREAAERDAAAERAEASKAAAAMRSDAERDSERILASSRAELSALQSSRTELLAQLASVRDSLDQVLTSGETSDQSIDVREPQPVEQL